MQDATARGFRRAAAFGSLAVLMLAGCGGAHRPPRRADAGPIRIALGDVGTLDPARAHTAEETELDWVLYTGLLTVRHAGGRGGERLVPGVAAALPRMSDGGRLLSVTLRRGLRFGDGRPLRATDVVATFERTLRTADSPVRRLLIDELSGAAAFAAGRAASITGLRVDGAGDGLTLRLRRADPAFPALLAQPALGIVPAGSPVHDRPGHPPAGIGPYRLAHVRAGRSFTLVRDRYWTALPGVPAAQVDVAVTLSGTADGAALAVLNDVLDVADPAQPIPPATLAAIRRLGAGRSRLVPVGRPTADLFLGTGAAPFDDGRARDAVVEALAAGQALAQAAARTVPATCGAMPLVTGSAPSAACPPGLAAGGALSAARSLVERSGTEGAPVTVWAPRSGPERGWVAAEAAELRAIGYDVRLVGLPAGAYRSEIEALVPRPAAGSTTSAGASGLRPLPRRGARRALRRVAESSVAAVVDGRLAGTVHAATGDALVLAVGPRLPLAQARRARRLRDAQAAALVLSSSRMDGPAIVIDPIAGLDLTSLRLR